MTESQENTNTKSGFTLIEIAIVLVIIGLLIGGIMKGQTMIGNAKVKALAQDIKAVATAMNAYQDRFRALPGDDPGVGVAGHLAAATVSTVPGDGLIDTGTWVGAALPVATNESSLFWQHVRMAGLATGSADVGQGTNSVGGRLGITTNLLRPDTPAGVEGTYVICSSGITGSLARQLDTVLDDGNAITGSVFAQDEAGGGPVVAATGALVNPYLDTSSYTVCQTF